MQTVPFSAPGLGIISTMITPAVLILAAGNLVTSTFSRVIRISDRARAMMGQYDAAKKEGRAGAMALYGELLAEYRKRSVLAERALSAFYLAIVMLVMASLGIAANRLLAERIPWVPVTLVVLGAVLLLAGVMSLFFETRISQGAIRREIDLHERNRA